MMDYEQLQAMVKRFETKRVKAFPNALTNNKQDFVKPFALLLRDIIDIVSTNIDDLCEPDECIWILGLQPTAMTIHSQTPVHTNRIINKKQSQAHYCCSLDYVIAACEKSASWQKTKSIIIDFTSGSVMDSQSFLAKLSNGIDTGRELGSLNGRGLSMVWDSLQLRSATL